MVILAPDDLTAVLPKAGPTSVLKNGNPSVKLEETFLGNINSYLLLPLSLEMPGEIFETFLKNFCREI